MFNEFLKHEKSGVNNHLKKLTCAKDRKYKGSQKEYKADNKT